MKFVLSLGLVFVCMVAFNVESAFAGSGKGGGKNATSVDISNTNSFMDEDGDIRVWLLSEDDVPPSTKADALELESVVLPGSAIASFLDLSGGDYILAVAKESSFQSLADEDAFAAGTDFNAAVFALEEGDSVEYCTSSSADSNIPDISECGGGDDGGDGNGGDGNGGSDG